MKIKNYAPIFLIIFICSVYAQSSGSPAANNEISVKAIWGPGMEMMHAIHDSCDSMKYPSFGDCFAAQMKNMGASPEAVQFTKMTDNQGFMRDFKECGKVDIAFAVYPFRANENQLCFLVNGYPAMIDIDDYSLTSKLNFKANSSYNKILKKFPNVSLWPGDRSGTDFAVVRNLQGGGKQFIFNYRLQDGCHACKLIGFANLAYTFNADGKLESVKIINIQQVNESTKDIKVLGEYKDSDKTIRVKSGQAFTIALQSNPTTGYLWQLSDPQNEEAAYFTGKIYLPPLNSLPGAGGKEEWSFMAGKPGSVEIHLKYTRPWEKDSKPAKQTVFKVIVEK